LGAHSEGLQQCLLRAEVVVDDASAVTGLLSDISQREVLRAVGGDQPGRRL